MLVEVLTRVAVVVAVLVACSLPLVGRERLRATRAEWRVRLRTVAPTLAVLAAVLVINRLARRRLPELSRRYGVRTTDLFYAVEGEFVLWFQRFATTELTAYFSFVYVYGYVYLLVLPVLAYFALSDSRPFRTLLSAYAINYAVGVAIYAVVLAYGPRQLLGGEIETVLYDVRPQYQHLTGEVNHNTNVFPSLHASLAVTVAILAYRTREAYPWWTVVAAVLAPSVVVSTMYLAIHWAIDVVAGIALAVLAVTLADRIVEGAPRSRLADRARSIRSRAPFDDRSGPVRTRRGE